jgi:putative transposase
MLAGKLREEGWEVNFKRVHRLWKQAGLRVPTKARKRRSLGSRLKAERRNHVWSYDFIFDQTSDGRRLKWLPLVDEFTKENLATSVRILTALHDPGEVCGQLFGSAPAYGLRYAKQQNQPQQPTKSLIEPGPKSGGRPDPSRAS